ncbi:MAG TPA: hypothetical protein VH796_13350 [Nitrososphaeraceae archaeon]
MEKKRTVPILFLAVPSGENGRHSLPVLIIEDAERFEHELRERDPHLARQHTFRRSKS